MAYRLTPEETVEQGIRRVALEQIDRALAEIRDASLNVHETVHQVRKRCKKIRGLVRLVRTVDEEAYARENAWFRDAAGELSSLRDAQSILESLDALIDHYRATTDPAAFRPLRERLADARRERARDEGLERKLDLFLDRMQEGRTRLASWSLDADGADAFAGGLGKTYRRGRRAMRRVRAEPIAENVHEWRKRAKYHGYHMRLLSPAWRGMLDSRAREVKKLSDHLGDERDLTLLWRSIRDGAGEAGGGTRDVETLAALIDRRRVELRAAAAAVGRRLYCEKPARLVERMSDYWKASDR